MRAPDHRGRLDVAGIGDIVCCLAFTAVSVVVMLELAGMACVAWRRLGTLLSALTG